MDSLYVQRLQKTMETSTIFHGTTHYFDWAIFNSYVFEITGWKQ